MRMFFWALMEICFVVLLYCRQNLFLMGFFCVWCYSSAEVKSCSFICLGGKVVARIRRKEESARKTLGIGWFKSGELDGYQGEA